MTEDMKMVRYILNKLCDQLITLNSDMKHLCYVVDSAQEDVESMIGELEELLNDD